MCRPMVCLGEWRGLANPRDVSGEWMGSGGACLGRFRRSVVCGPRTSYCFDAGRRDFIAPAPQLASGASRSAAAVGCGPDARAPHFSVSQSAMLLPRLVREKELARYLTSLFIFNLAAPFECTWAW